MYSIAMIMDMVSFRHLICHILFDVAIVAAVSAVDQQIFDLKDIAFSFFLHGI